MNQFQTYMDILRSDLEQLQRSTEVYTGLCADAQRNHMHLLSDTCWKRVHQNAEAIKTIKLQLAQLEN